MRTQGVGFLVQVAPMVVSWIGMVTLSVHAAEVPSVTESAIAGASIGRSAKELEPALTAVEDGDVNAAIISPQPELQFKEIVEQDILAIGHANIAAVASEGSQLDQSVISFTQLELSAASGNSSLNNSHQDDSRSTQFILADTSRDLSENPLSNPPRNHLMPDAALSGESFALDWPIAQAEPVPETPPELEEPAPDSEVTTASPRWQVSFTPYGFVPLSVDGSATVRDFTADINLGLDDILDPLNFAAAGRVEAWKGNLGFIFDGSYLSATQESSTSTSVPDCLCNIFPSRIDTEVNVQYGQFDLGVGYRTAANLADAATEFDLGPLVFDAIAGMRIYALHQEINLSTDLGTDREREGSSTIVTPLVSGRLRWNVSPTVAGWVRGDIAGFGISGTLMAASVTGGVEWMFSGDTSLLLAYRISSLQYDTEIRGEDFELDLLLQGPYMGVVFRF